MNDKLPTSDDFAKAALASAPLLLAFRERLTQLSLEIARVTEIVFRAHGLLTELHVEDEDESP